MDTYQREEHTVHNSPLTFSQMNQLMMGLNPQRISKRKQGGRDLSYLEAWDVKATLIRVFGFGGFSAEAFDAKVVHVENNIRKTSGYGKDKTEKPIAYDQDGQVTPGTANFRVSVMVGMKLTIHQTGAVYTEYAASSQTGPDYGDVLDFAIKTAESDALKRAAINLGTQFGLSLYNNGSTNDVVKVILAPDQQPDTVPGSPNYVPLQVDKAKDVQTPVDPAALPQNQPDPEAQAEVQNLQRIVHGETSVSHDDPVRFDGVTSEQRAEGQELVDRALGMRQAREAAAQGSTPTEQ
jgi:hypothetical protein